MKTLFLYAALGVAISASVPAMAAEADQPARSGHYEWRTVPQFGPRATGPTRKRVWVPDQVSKTDCECAMMKTNPAECMKDMHSRVSSPAAPSVG
ncbi:hypothetical protein [Sphingomonas sp. KC8]|uniref:hypothetical protein n=1 Tax=Sphingomonas sp. KC8 TaxID=1030157 RepID=UPI0003131594|nr:hypothetical protein [Sphingomonas sp. KC8]ARS26960.1 hypothetical protein KC8_06610 [Sphingomonas sp. KC8]